MKRWVIGAALLAQMGCIKRVSEEPGVVGRASVYYPLHVGNRWVYEGRFLGQAQTQTIEVVREQDGFFEDTQGGRFRVDPEGVRDEKRYLLREPLRVGQSWSNVVSVSSVERYAVVAANQPCQVPAGRFPDCVQVEGRNRVDDRTTLLNELTFAAGVGLVRVQVVAETLGKRILQTSMELKSYAVSPVRP